MQFNDYLYRTGAYLRHFFTSTNTIGHGIHSPYLFHLVNMVIYDDNPYYCFRELEQERLRYLANSLKINTTDYGTGHSRSTTISRIATHCLASPREAQTLFRVLQDLHPKTILELGTSLGLTTAYLAKSTPQAKVLTFEGDPTIADQAAQLFKRLNINNIEQIIDNIDNTLNSQLSTFNSQLDFAFLDANHTCEATLRYFNTILPYCYEKTILVFDDIHYSRDMGKAWEAIKAHPQVTSTFDFYDFGFVFLNPHFLHKHYRMRL